MPSSDRVLLVRHSHKLIARVLLWPPLFGSDPVFGIYPQNAIRLVAQADCASCLVSCLTISPALCATRSVCARGQRTRVVFDAVAEDRTPVSVGRREGFDQKGETRCFKKAGCGRDCIQSWFIQWPR